MPTKSVFAFQEGGPKTKKLYLYDTVTKFGELNWNTWEYEESETSANFFKKELAEIPEDGTIELHINSNGGSVGEGVTIYNQLANHKAYKIGYVDGNAYSVASLIFQACDRRIMGQGTSMLIHNMWMQVAGNAKELRKAADDLDTLMETNRKIYLNRSKLTEEKLIEMMEQETILTPEQCLEYGLCDVIQVMKPREGKTDDGGQQAAALMEQIQQMQREAARQKSLREEMLCFMQQGIQEPEQENKGKPLAYSIIEAFIKK